VKFINQSYGFARSLRKKTMSLYGAMPAPGSYQQVV